MWLALGIVAGLLTIALVVWMLHPVPDADARAREVRLTVKGRYLAEIDVLYQRFAAGEITERQLHHALSKTVRRYADEHGAPGALAMTAVDLRAAGLDDAAGVIARYQPPQFIEQPASDPPTVRRRRPGADRGMVSEASHPAARAPASPPAMGFGARSPRETW